MDNVCIVGTSHIAAQSKKDIKKAFDEFEPDVVAVELDKQRLQGLLSGQKPKVTMALIPKIGAVGYLFLKIGSYTQQKLGNLVNVEPGSEMKYAFHLANKNEKKVMLADRPIQLTLARLSKFWTRKEKFKMIWDVLKSPFSKEKMSIDLKKVPEGKELETILLVFKKQYPKLYNILVHERNVYMTTMIKNYLKDNPEHKVLAVVGAGHKEGMEKLLGENS